MSRLLTEGQVSRLEQLMRELDALGNELAKGGVILLVNRSYDLEDAGYGIRFKASCQISEKYDCGDGLL